MFQAILRTTAFITLLGLTAACSTTPVTTTGSSGSRYSIQQDRAPSADIGLAEIAEVIPEPLQRTMAGNRSPYTVLGKTYRVLPTELGYNERGVASWYGEKFHGHKTSNGEVFDMYQASAAHKSLPIPSFLRVTNLDNNRSIIVRVNDRGPFHGDRIIDLSYAAALKLGYSDRGTARVQLESIIVDGSLADRPVNSAARSNLQVLARVAGVEKYIQVGAFTELSRAQELSRQLRRLTGKPVIIRSVDNRATGVLHRVRVGPVTDPAEIRQITQSVVAANLGSPYTVTE
jgi:rare lipoprotein A